MLLTLQGTYVGWMSQVLPNITRMRNMEAAAAVDPARFTAPEDIPFSQLFSDWVDSNEGRWQPQQEPIANALMTTNVQVRWPSNSLG